MFILFGGAHVSDKGPGNKYLCLCGYFRPCGYCSRVSSTGWLKNNRNSCLAVLDVRKSKIKVMADLVSGPH